MASATGGSVLCLAAGNYGAFTGAQKTSPGVTITADTAAGANNSNVIFGQVDLSNAAWITLDNVKLGGGNDQNDGLDIVPSSNSHDHFTFSNDVFTSFVVIDYSGASSSYAPTITFDDDNFTYATAASCGAGGPTNAYMHLAWSASVTTHITLENSQFANGDCDGVHTGSAMMIKDNTFRNFCDVGTNHTDNIQIEGMPADGMTIEGNYIYEPKGCTTQAITSYGPGPSQNMLIENNVIDMQRQYCIEVYNDTDSIVRHNTCYTARPLPDPGACDDYPTLPCGMIDIDAKATSGGGSPGSGTHVYDNVAYNVQFNCNGGNCGAGTEDHNLLLGGGSGAGDIAGAATLVDPSVLSWAGGCLASGSLGLTGADDGGRIGVRTGVSGTC
jgi:hypothetical protein